jgi:beta-lactamase regulating signal transducer with metallopeptidase domain
MSEHWAFFEEWLLHSTLGGGLLLLLTWGLMRRCRQPARRQRLGEWGITAALLLAVLSLGPHWLLLPLLPRAPVVPEATVAAPAPPAPTSRAPARPSAGLDQERVTSAVRPESSDTLLIAAAPPPATFRPPLVAQDVDVVLGTLVSAAARAPAAPPDPAPPQEETPSPEPPPTVPATTAGLAPATLAAWLAGAYALGAGLLLLRWLVGHVALRRLLRGARPAPAPAVQLFEAMAAGQPRPRLLISDRLRVPISCGLVRPTVLVPASLCAPEARETLRWVFAHELTHLERRDAWACLLFGLGQIVYFALPWFWWLRRQVRLCQEYVADAAAAEQAAHVEDYAQFLLCLTTSPAVSVPATGVVGNSSDLFRRVTMLLQDPLRVERRCPYWLSCAAAGALLVLAVCGSGLGLTAAEPAPVPADQDTYFEAKFAAANTAARQETQEEADKKEKAKDKKAEKEEKGDKSSIILELDALLKSLPKDADREQIRAEIQKAVEQIRKLAKEQAEWAKGLKDGELKAWKDAAKFGEQFKDFNTLYHARLGEGRLGIGAERPSQALADQLDLPKGQGLVIDNVQAGSPAAKAGLKPHDVLLEVAGKPVPSDVQALVKLLAEHKGDAGFDLLVLRKGRKETIKGVKLGEARGQTLQRVQPEGGVFSGKQLTVPAVPGVPAMPGVQAFGPGGQSVITTTFRTDDRFTTRHQEGSLIITVTGTVGEGKAKVNEIQIQDGARTTKHTSVNRVPEQYRDKVKNLIEMSEKSNVRIEIKGEIRKPKKQDN